MLLRKQRTNIYSAYSNFKETTSGHLRGLFYFVTLSF